MFKLRKRSGSYSKIFITLITLIVVTLTSCGGGGESDGGTIKPPWPKTFGGAEDEVGRFICTDSLENVYVVGTFRDSVDFGEGTIASKGNTDIYIIKYTSEGEYLWSKTIGGTGVDTGSTIAVDSADNIYIGGIFQGAVDFGGGIVNSKGTSDGYLVKYTTDGDYVWVKTIGETGSSFGGGNIYIDSSDNIYIAGHFTGTVNFGAGNQTSKGFYDVFLVKYSIAGNYIWSKTLGGNGVDFAFFITGDSSDNVYITGYFDGTANFGAGNQTSNGETDIFLVKYSSAGNYLWSKTFGGNGFDSVSSLHVDSYDNIYVAGGFRQTVNFGGGNITSGGSFDGFIAKYSSTGVYETVKTISGIGGVRVFSILIDSDNYIYASGEFSNTVNFGSGNIASRGKADIFIVKYNLDLTLQWIETLGGVEDDLGRIICKDTSGNLYLIGEFQETVNFGYGNETSNGKRDVFIFKN